MGSRPRIRLRPGRLRARPLRSLHRVLESRVSAIRPARAHRRHLRRGCAQGRVRWKPGAAEAAGHRHGHGPRADQLHPPGQDQHLRSRHPRTTRRVRTKREPSPDHSLGAHRRGPPARGDLCHRGRRDSVKRRQGICPAAPHPARGDSRTKNGAFRPAQRRCGRRGFDVQRPLPGAARARGAHRRGRQGGVRPFRPNSRAGHGTVRENRRPAHEDDRGRRRVSPPRHVRLSPGAHARACG